MSSVKYKGYEITASPAQIAENGEWDLRVVIYKEENGESKEFVGKNTFDSREKAEERALKFGKFIIEGYFPEYSLEDLK